MENNNHRVVVSGVGMITALGTNTPETWTAILSGKTGIQETPEGLQAPIHNFMMNGARSRMGDFALAAAAEAVHTAGLNPAQLKDSKTGCAISQSKPPLVYDYLDSSHSRLNSSLLLSSFFGWSSEAVVQNHFKLGGPSGNTTAACATGVASIELGAYWIKSGICDRVLVGAAESSLTPLYLSGFHQMGVVAHGSKPSDVCPFDRHRSGFAIGEGAGVLVLESWESAHARGHKPLVELENVALQHSALDAVRFDSDGLAVSRLLRKVVGSRSAPDYINAHGTATKLNDLIECRGIQKTFPEMIDDIYVSSTKAATGHLLGAAGAVEAVLSVLALQDQKIPPTLNLNDPDSDCDVHHVPQTAVSATLHSAVSLSYGFGGQMGAVLFTKYQGEKDER